eukprot:TRINITY_DN109215_c0_g1_i1.p1 TRINITY_DN109215_c0_g1~~TRINITY_DN109215_c0_g1_i1.p1  ORF type:complete len:799 (-),score=112.50 TRINITY_DN109215_c0_g1_i1:250-2646(-)
MVTTRQGTQVTRLSAKELPKVKRPHGTACDGRRRRTVKRRRQRARKVKNSLSAPGSAAEAPDALVTIQSTSVQDTVSGRSGSMMQTSLVTPAFETSEVVAESKEVCRKITFCDLELRLFTDHQNVWWVVLPHSWKFNDWLDKRGLRSRRAKLLLSANLRNSGREVPWAVQLEIKSSQESQSSRKSSWAYKAVHERTWREVLEALRLEQKYVDEWDAQLSKLSPTPGIGVVGAFHGHDKDQTGEKLATTFNETKRGLVFVEEAPGTRRTKSRLRGVQAALEPEQQQSVEISPPERTKSVVLRRVPNQRKLQTLQEEDGIMISKLGTSCYACLVAQRPCKERLFHVTGLRAQPCEACRHHGLSFRQCAVPRHDRAITKGYTGRPCHICNRGMAPGPEASVCCNCGIWVCGAEECRAAARVLPKAPYWFCCHCLGVPLECKCDWQCLLEVKDILLHKGYNRNLPLECRAANGPIRAEELHRGTRLHRFWTAGNDVLYRPQAKPESWLDDAARLRGWSLEEHCRLLTELQHLREESEKIQCAEARSWRHALLCEAWLEAQNFGPPAAVLNHLQRVRDSAAKEKYAGYKSYLPTQEESQVAGWPTILSLPAFSELPELHQPKVKRKKQVMLPMRRRRDKKTGKPLLLRRSKRFFGLRKLEAGLRKLQPKVQTEDGLKTVRDGFMHPSEGLVPEMPAEVLQPLVPATAEQALVDADISQQKQQRQETKEQKVEARLKGVLRSKRSHWKGLLAPRLGQKIIFEDTAGKPASTGRRGPSCTAASRSKTRKRRIEHKVQAALCDMSA